MKNARAYLLLGSALLLCPCHLPIMIGLLVAGGVGGALGGILVENMLWFIAVATAYFVFALWMGSRLLSHATHENAPVSSTTDSCCLSVSVTRRRPAPGGER